MALLRRLRDPLAHRDNDDDQKCQICHHPREYGAYEEVCKNCGLVFPEYCSISDAPEWTNYGDDRPDKARCSVNKDFYGYIAPNMYRLSRSSTRREKRDIFRHVLPRQQRLQLGAQSIRLICEQNDISRCIRDSALCLWEVVIDFYDDKDTEFNSNRGGNRKGIIACCLYYGYCLNNIKRPSSEIIDMCRINNTMFCKGRNIMHEILSSSPKYAHLLDVGFDSYTYFSTFIQKIFDTDRRTLAQMINKCQRLYDIDYIRKQFRGHSDDIVVIGIIAFVFRHDASIENVSRLTGKTTMSIANIYHIIERSLGYIKKRQKAG